MFHIRDLCQRKISTAELFQSSRRVNLVTLSVRPVHIGNNLVSTDRFSIAEPISAELARRPSIASKFPRNGTYGDNISAESPQHTGKIHDLKMKGGTLAKRRQKSTPSAHNISKDAAASPYCHSANR